MTRVGLVLGAAATFATLGTTPANAAMSAHGSAKQVYATGLKPKATAALLNKSGRTVKTRRAGGQGGVLFRNVKPGDGYRVRSGGETSDPLTVFTERAAPPSTDVYDQQIPSSGYGYLTTRDGTKLAYTVHPPTDVTGAFPTGKIPVPDDGPWPTLVEYSGYGYADPAGPESGISVIANAYGFAVIDVNMRGTGCSGGAFDFFEPLQNLDGYDVVETVARQPWVKHGKVGMLGISYGGISQLFTAQLQPPSLAAITPISLIDSAATTLYPGGVLNTGFALAWSIDRIEDARPAGPGEKEGQRWAWERIENGDEVCKENQALHDQAADLMQKIRDNATYKSKVVDPVSPVKFVHKINVPTFMACQWQDEQTGGHCPTLASRLTGTDKKWITFTNGTHIDSLGPETFNRWYDFMKLYVAREAPAVYAPVLQGSCPVVYMEAMGIDGVTCRPDPIQQEPTYEGALAAFEALPSVRILFDNGAGGDPGFPYPGFEHSFERFPIPGTKGRTWYFGPKGVLSDKRPARGGVNTFTWDPKARPPTSLAKDTSTGSGENGLWTATTAWDWRQPAKKNVASYVSSPLEENTVVIGSGYVKTWIRSGAPRTDLQVTVTELRPDGKETFVQGGWLRGDIRALDKKMSKPLSPWLSLRARDISPLPSKGFAKATIPLFYEGHAYRAGSRIRVYITAPNGDQPVWAFAEAQPKGKKPKVSIAFSKKRPSQLVLPTVPGVEIPTELPPCPGLRGQPCRDYPG